MPNNIVAIVGRPNVGKSTFFNRLVGERRAIMDDQPGVTRDRHYGQAEWVGKFFTVVDTGGYVVGSDDKFEGAIREQVEIALEEAAIIFFMVDVETGITGLDKDFANVLRRTSKPIFLVVNKADSPERHHLAGEFHALGMGEPYPLSSINGTGTGELLDEVVKHIAEEGEEDPDAGIPKLAVLGRPNVGKSSFVNVLLGQERSIVTAEAGTTRDAINARYKAYGQDFILVDTAGLRRKARVQATRDGSVEFYSTMRSIRAMEESDVSIVMIDATRGLEAQDMNIIALAERRRKGIVILVNKWDLVEKDHRTADQYKKAIYERIEPFTFIPVMFISALTKQRIFQAVELAIAVYEDRKRKVPTSQLNEKLLAEIERNPPPALKGKYIRIKYVTQLPTATPSFAFFCNLPQYIKESYQRFLENKIREHFGFSGVPINVFFRKK